MKKILTLTLVAVALINVNGLCGEYEKVSPTTAKRAYTVQVEETLNLDTLIRRQKDLETSLVEVKARIAGARETGAKPTAELND